jgi:hypothetical protein
MTNNVSVRAFNREFIPVDWGGDQDLMVRYGASPQTRALIDQANNLRTIGTYATYTTPQASLADIKVAVPSLPERLFDALADAKIYTSHVAMRMDREWRTKLFCQLDSLLDPEEWDDSDQPLRKESFATFLKAMFLILPQRRPGLGVARSGNLIGMWTVGQARLTMEFLSGDMVRIILSRQQEDITERAALDTEVTRLLDVLAPYNPDLWFCYGDH